MRKVLVCLLVVLVAACGAGVNGENSFIGFEGSCRWMKTADPKTVKTYYGNQCFIFTADPNTTEFDKCVERYFDYELERQKCKLLNSDAELINMKTRIFGELEK